MFFDIFKNKKKNPVEFSEFTGTIFPQKPRVKLLNNGKLTSVLCDSGISFLKSGYGNITKRPFDTIRVPKGSYCMINQGGEQFSSTFAPFYSKTPHYETAFSPCSVTYFASTKTIKAETKVMLNKEESYEQRNVTIYNKEGNQISCDLLFYLEPDVELGYAEFDFKNNILIQKLKNETGYIAVGLLEDQEVFMTADRELIAQDGDLTDVKLTAFTEEDGGKQGDICAIRTALTIEKGQSGTATMITAYGETAKMVVDMILKHRARPPLDTDYAATDCKKYGHNTDRLLKTLLSQTVFLKRDSTVHLNAIDDNERSSDSLYGVKIPDLPEIVVVDIYSKNDLERVKLYAKVHSILKAAFLEFQLIFLFDNGLATKNGIIKQLDEKGYGQEKSIHIIEKSVISSEMLTLIYASACHIASRSMVRIEAPYQEYIPIKIKSVLPNMQSENKLPQKQPYIVTNGEMIAYLFKNCIGFTAYKSSESSYATAKITDTLHDSQSEMLILKLDEEYFDVVNGANLELEEDRFCYYSKVNEMEIKTIVSFPQENIKLIEIIITNTGLEKYNPQICCYIEPVMSNTRKKAKFIKSETGDKMIILHSPCGGLFQKNLAIDAHGFDFSVCYDRPSFWCGRWDYEGSLPSYDSCAALIVKRALLPQKEIRIQFTMAMAQTVTGAKLAMLAVRGKRCNIKRR